MKRANETRHYDMLWIYDNRIQTEPPSKPQHHYIIAPYQDFFIETNEYVYQFCFRFFSKDEDSLCIYSTRIIKKKEEEKEFNFVVLKYSDRPAMGEALNIGVLVYDPETKMAYLKRTSNTKRLESAFKGFNKEQYEETMRALEEEIKIKTSSNTYRDAEELLRDIWSDLGLSYFCSSLKTGITTISIQEQTKKLYEAFVGENEQ